MGEHPLRRILSKALALTPDDYTIVYIHRGAPSGAMELRLSEVSKIGKGSFTLGDGDTQIPFHRILLVTNLDGSRVLWTKRPPREHGAQDP